MITITKIVYIVILIFLVHDINSQSDKVKYIPGIGFPMTNTYAGYVTVNNITNANLYYLFWQAQNTTVDTPVVLWLNGGPGYSSLAGSFIENGPYLVTDNGTFIHNSYSWNRNAHMLYVDQPVGTGYSYVSDVHGHVHTEQSIGQDMLCLLNGFFSFHPEFANQDFFIFGESYAGKFIPTISRYIQKFSNIRLKAIGMGNGWIDPVIQNESYCKYLYMQGLVTNETVAKQMRMYERYLFYTSKNDSVMTNLLTYEMLLYCSISGGCLDVYDINNKIFQNPTSKLGDLLEKWLNLPDVKKAFNSKHKYVIQSDISYIALLNDFNLSEKTLIKNLLDYELPILLYYGHDDIICNYVGSYDWISKIGWSGQINFNNATLTEWNVKNNTVGQYKSVSGLSYCLIFNAGHMVPYYQPEISLIMFETFLREYNNTLGFL